MPRKAEYSTEWTRLSAAVRAATPQCAWCGTTVDLTTDHLVPGKPQFGVRVLCRTDNTRRRNGATGPARAPGTQPTTLPPRQG